MKRFKGVILALAMVMGIGMVKPAEAHAIPTEVISKAWLRHKNETSGEWIPVGRWYTALNHRSNGRVYVAKFGFPASHVGTIHYSNLAMNHEVTWGVNFRSWPATGDNILGRIPKGTKLLVGENGGRGSWAQVRWNGMVGYVSMQYLDPLTKFLPS